MSSSLRLDYCSQKAAAYACKHWHYAGQIPPPPLVRIGVWEHDRFVGAVVFGRGATPKMFNPYGYTTTQGAELVRIALRRHEAHVTRIVSVAIRLLKRRCPGLQMLVSFADPQYGHTGAIYRAGNWIEAGKTAPMQMFRAPNGKLLHPRVVSVSGVAKYYGEYKAVWRPDQCEAVSVPGKYRFLMPLTRSARKRLEAFKQQRAGSIDSDAADLPDRRGRCKSDPGASS